MMSTMSVNTAVYDVFLSFRGSDTRQGFTDTLYNILVHAGIRVFRDDDELRTGDKIEVILQAIKDSKICIPIFSKNYATSAWCLRELAKMVELNKEILPILFNAEAEDVKLVTPLYRDQLMAHVEKHGEEKVGLWKQALRQVGRIKLSKLDKKGYYEFCQEFVKEDISRRLKLKQKHVTEHFVGRDSEVQIALKLINDDDQANGEVLLGIHGIGAVGKTTLAKVIFNQLSASFDCCSFVEGIRESSRINGIEHLQKQLLNDLSDKLKDALHFIDPLVLMKANFSNKKVLIVLDDVSEKQQIVNLIGKTSRFGSGSRIIVTTRDRRVLNIDQQEKVEAAGTVQKRVIWTMEVWGLNPAQALQLFSLHAFKSDSPAQEYQHLSKEVVSTTAGLPLALEAAGSALRWRLDEGTWRSTIKRLKETPDPEVKKRLMTSFDALDRREQQIFLDIACFFIYTTSSSSSSSSEEEETSSPINYLSEMYLQPELETLISMSLIKLGENNVLWMHDQIRELGRVIARDTSSENRKSCRLWVHEEAVKMLKRKKDNDNIISLRLDQPCNGDLTGDEFVDLNNLRLLSLREPNFTKGFKGPLPNLTWLSLHACPDTLSTAKLNSSKLLVLDLAYSKIDGKWNGWRHFQMECLKVLHLSYCRDLTSTPDLSKMEHLEKLVLEGCCNLTKIKVSKDRLKSLRNVNLKDCHSLVVLPKELFTGGNLEWLSLQNCHQITQFPDLLERSRSSLVTLDLSGTSIARMPNFVGDFRKLRDLSLGGSKIEHLSESVLCRLESLVRLDLSCSNVRELPNDIGDHLKRLECLLLVGCSSVKKLPDTIGSLGSSLVMLDLSGSAITELPDSIGRLTRLESLSLAECKEIHKLPESSFGDMKSLKVFIANSSSLTKLPKSIGRLKNLERIDMAWSKTLRRLPLEIGELSGLTSVNLSGTCIRHLPSTMSRLSRLTTLELVDCDRLRELPELPESLTKLHVKSCRLKKVPNLMKLINLTDLKLIDGSLSKRWTRVESSGLQWIVKLTKLTKLELCLSNVTPLPSNLRALSQLESVIIDCPSFKRIPELPCSVLEVHLLSISSDVRVRDLSALTNLKVLRIQGFANVQSLYLPQSLESLQLFNCRSLSADFLSGSHLKNLVNLEVVRCAEVVELGSLERAESLESLSIETCESLEQIGNLSELRQLIHLKVTDCPKVRTTIEGQLSASLKSTDFSGSDFLSAMKMSQVSVALPIPRAIKGFPGSAYLKDKLSEQQMLYEKAQNILKKVEKKVCVRLPGSETLVDAFIKHKEELHSITHRVSTKLAKKIFSKFRRNEEDISNKMFRTNRREGCYLTWLELSEHRQDLPSEKGWSECDESEEEDDDITEVEKDYPDKRSLLASPGGRDFLTQNDGNQVKIDNLGVVRRLTLYFAASWSFQCLMPTIMMALEYPRGGGDKTSTEVVVFVSLDEDEESFRRHFAMMPWLAIPFSDTDKRKSLVELFDVKKVPQLVIIDECGKVTFDRCEGPREIFPCPPERLKELKEQKEAAQRDQSLRSVLVLHGSRDFVISLSEGKIVPISHLEGKVVCLFFPSFFDSENDIDERLCQVYETLKEDGEDFEIVMILPGRYDEDTIWEDVLGSSNNGFLFLVHPNVFGQLISYFDLSTFPALVMIGSDGKTLLSNATEAVSKYGAEAFPFTPERLKELQMQVSLMDA